ncbi:MAG: Magnesium and cobalt efflux protein CorC [uncultured Thermoleophilia bacterium]|uniref:Magnesium and cobalt efflux protein CorC n=1 Tax=uncultured Thermoleophilia bacterium TaxID=1497501 RepID=A0A6J4UBD7_9ACTN|nr:MAG: Magnesium and cobalt efflux protein CorC [uncultured Thermoleophilia bacterium]
MTTFSLVAIGVLLLLNGYFVAAEFALVSTRPERLKGDSRVGRLVQRQRRHLDEYLSACQLGITIASLALGALGEPTLAHLIEPALGSAPIAHLGAATATVLALLLMTALHITIGEQAPKSFAIGSAERVATLAAWPLELFYRSLKPLVQVLNAASNGLVRALGGTPAAEHGGRATINELRQMIYAVASTGEVDTTDERILRGMFTLDERRASDVMTPFPRLATAEAGQTVEDVLRMAVPSGHSRIPVMDPQADRRALGVVFVRDLTEALLQGRGDRPVEAYLHELLVTPETQPLDRLLARMQRARASIAAVLDEYGQLAGVISVEDIVEQIVGEIEDESDRPTSIRRLRDGRIVCPGDTPLSDLEAQGVHLGEAQSESVGGLILELLDAVAQAGDTAETDGYRLRVLAVDGHRVDRVLIAPKQPVGATAERHDG